MKTLKEKIEVMQAALDGEDLEKSCNSGLWAPVFAHACNWDWALFDYRIKPKPLEFWVNVYGNNQSYPAVYESKQKAKDSAAVSQVCVIKTIKVREVLE